MRKKKPRLMFTIRQNRNDYSYEILTIDDTGLLFPVSKYTFTTLEKAMNYVGAKEEEIHVDYVDNPSYQLALKLEAFKDKTWTNLSDIQNHINRLELMFYIGFIILALAIAIFYFLPTT